MHHKLLILYGAAAAQPGRGKRKHDGAVGGRGKGCASKKS